MRSDQAGTAVRGDHRPTPTPTAPVTRLLAAAGTAALALGVALLAALHVLPPSARVDPVRRTLSQYALLDNGWAFDVAVLLLAAGSTAILAALLRSGVTHRRAGGAAALSLWCASLVAVVVFEKHNWAVGPSLSGDIHRVAGLVAFLSLPAGAVLVGVPWLGDPRWAGPARWSVAGGLLSLLWFGPIAAAYLTQPWTGVPWWQAVPLGALERLLGATEVATLVVLALWAARAASGRR